MYKGNPALGNSTLICTYNDSVASVSTTITANANKPDSFTVSGTPVLGRTFTVTVSGATGTIGSNVASDPYVLSLSPSMGQTWPAGSYMLTNITTSFGSGTIAKTDDFLRTNFSSSDNSNRTYVTKYTFYVRKAVNSVTTPSPRTVIGSGTQVKISVPATTIQNIPASTDPVTDGTFTQVITSSTDWATKRVTYTVTYTNTGSSPVCLDQMKVTPTDSLGTWTYVAGSTTHDGNPDDDPYVTSTDLTYESFCVPGTGTTVRTFQIDFSGSLTTSVEGDIGDTTVTPGTPTGTASLKVHVDSTTYNEKYDGVEVSVSQAGGAFTYKTGVTDANGDVDFGPIDADQNYQIKLKAPCDNRPVDTKSSFAVTTGEVVKSYTLAATVPCTPVLTYNKGTDTLSWTHPNDGGSYIRYYTYHYNDLPRIAAGKPWGIFARYWPADMRTVPFATYAKTGCPARSATISPLPFDKNPECLRALGVPKSAKTYRWRVAARNQVPTPGVTTPNGIGWSAPSDVITGIRP